MRNVYIKIDNDYIIQLDAISAYRMYNSKLELKCLHDKYGE